MFIYKNYDQEGLDRQYNNRLNVPDFATYLVRWEMLSRETENMYDIRQFKPALYFLIILGLSGFALAAQSPGLWVLSVGAVMFNAWLVKTNRFTLLFTAASIRFIEPIRLLL